MFLNLRNPSTIVQQDHWLASHFPARALEIGAFVSANGALTQAATPHAAESEIIRHLYQRKLPSNISAPFLVAPKT
jgi:hypothetical protein